MPATVLTLQWVKMLQVKQASQEIEILKFKYVGHQRHTQKGRKKWEHKNFLPPRS